MKPFSALSAAGRRAACPPAFLPSRGRRPAREIATRELRSEWSISKPALALLTLRRPPNQWCMVADVWLGASSRIQPWSCRRPPAPRPARPLAVHAANSARHVGLKPGLPRRPCGCLQSGTDIGIRE